MEACRFRTQNFSCYSIKVFIKTKFQDVLKISILILIRAHSFNENLMIEEGKVRNRETIELRICLFALNYLLVPFFRYEKSLFLAILSSLIALFFVPNRNKISVIFVTCSHQIMVRVPPLL